MAKTVLQHIEEAEEDIQDRLHSLSKEIRRQGLVLGKLEVELVQHSTCGKVDDVMVVHVRIEVERP